MEISLLRGLALRLRLARNSSPTLYGPDQEAPVLTWGVTTVEETDDSDDEEDG